MKPKYNPPIIHIGLPKTGTTSLKKYVFPKLCNEVGFEFNPVEFLKIGRQRLNYTLQDKKALQDLFETKKVFISREHLVDSNPRNWENAAEKILDLFGKEAKIVITIRNPLDYFNSIYLQLIHNNNFVKPDDFFVNSIEYDKLKPYLPKESLMRYDFDKFNYKNLKEIYESRFSNVYFVPLSRVDTFYPYDRLFHLNEETISKYKTIFKHSPKENRSYSEIAFKLSFLRERFFRLFGLKSVGAEDIPEDNSFLSYSKKIIKFSDMKTDEKLKFFIPKLIFKFQNTFGSWRWWMQNFVDKIYPYKKYTLPDVVISKINNRLMEDNYSFVKDLEKLIDDGTK